MADLLPSTPDTSDARGEDPRVIGLDSEDADELIAALASNTARRIVAALHEDAATPSALAERVDTTLQNTQYHLKKLEDAGIIQVADTAYSEKGREMKVYAPADRALVVVAGREDETAGLRSALTNLLGGLGVLGVASVVLDRLLRRSVFPVGVSNGPPADEVSGGSQGDAGDGGSGGSSTDGGASGGGGGSSADGVSGGDSGGASVTDLETTESVETTTASTAEPTGTPTAEATATPTAEAATTPTPQSTTVRSTEATTPTPAGTSTATPTSEATPASELVETTTAIAQTAADSAPEAAALVGVSPGLLFFLGGATVLVGWFVLRRRGE
ncbi:MAG: ArsR/SmtB family transcription factor [Halobacteriota archaeon]